MKKQTVKRNSSLKRRPVRSWTLATRLEHRRVRGKKTRNK